MNKFLECIQKPVHFFIYRLLMRNLLRFFFGLSYQKNNSLRNLKQVVIVANHNSHLDTMAVLASLPSSLLSKVHPVAAGDYFGKNNLIRLLSEFFVNTVLISRKKNNVNKKVLENIEEILNKGHSILIFPEGSRGTADILQNFKHGTAILLKKYPLIPFVPIFLKGMGRALPKGDPCIVPVECQMIIGDPIWIENIEEREIVEITEIVKQAILELEKKVNG